MTTEHEEAVRLAPKFCAALRHDAEGAVTMLWMTPPALAALIADVRRQKGEEDAAICDEAFADANWNPLLKNAAGVCADTIRARLEEGECSLKY